MYHLVWGHNGKTFTHTIHTVSAKKCKTNHCLINYVTIYVKLVNILTFKCPIFKYLRLARCSYKYFKILLSKIKHLATNLWRIMCHNYPNSQFK